MESRSQVTVEGALHRLWVPVLALPGLFAAGVVAGHVGLVGLGALALLGFNVAAGWRAVPGQALINLGALAGLGAFAGPVAPLLAVVAVPMAVARPLARLGAGLIAAATLPELVRHGATWPTGGALGAAALTWLVAGWALARARVHLRGWLEAGARTEQAALAKADFLVAMSHELRTPMNTVLGVGRLLDGATLTAEQRAHLEVMRESGEDLLAIVDDLLDFSRLEAGRMTIDAVPFDVQQLVAGVARRFSAEARGRGLGLRTQVHPALAPMYVGDPNRVRQVLVNLVGNALKFTDRGEVVVGVRPNRAEDGVVWWVRDTGIGIEPERLATLFQPFQQADRSTARRFGGSGLGLAISRALAELMGGELCVQSVVGEGSTFRFEQALAVAPAGALPATPAPQAGPFVGRGRRVWVVDDELVARTVTARVLGKAGFEVEVFDDGAPALARLFESEGAWPDAMVLDVQMPTVDGLEVVRQVRAAESGRLPIIGLTAGSGDAVRSQCLAVGFDTVLLKPVAPERLCAEVDAQATR